MEDVTLLFTLGAIPLIISLSHPLGVAGRGKPHLKLLVLFIPYSPREDLTLFLAVASFL